MARRPRWEREPHQRRSSVTAAALPATTRPSSLLIVRWGASMLLIHWRAPRTVCVRHFHRARRSR
eukprot:6497378-Alexandrium_andersonii.AAC.1